MSEELGNVSGEARGRAKAEGALARKLAIVLRRMMADRTGFAVGKVPAKDRER